MKLQISFNLMDLDKAVSIAKDVKEYCDAFEVGSLLISQYGMDAVREFRKHFPDKLIVCDNKVVEHEKEMIEVAAQAGSNWVTVLAGADNNVIHNACNAAHNLGKKVMLNLIDSSSFGQTALEAQTLGADALLLHRITDENSQNVFLDRWDMVKGNTKLPIFISTHITRENINEIISINPDGIVIGYAITRSDNPKETAEYFYKLINS